MLLLVVGFLSVDPVYLGTAVLSVSTSNQHNHRESWGQHRHRKFLIFDYFLCNQVMGRRSAPGGKPITFRNRT